MLGQESRGAGGTAGRLKNRNRKWKRCLPEKKRHLVIRRSSKNGDGGTWGVKKKRFAKKKRSIGGVLEIWEWGNKEKSQLARGRLESQFVAGKGAPGRQSNSV